MNIHDFLIKNRHNVGMFGKRTHDHPPPMAITKVVEADIANVETQLETLWAHTAPNLARYSNEPLPKKHFEIVNMNAFLQGLADGYMRLNAASNFDDAALLAPETRFAAQRMNETLMHDLQRLEDEGTHLPPSGFDAFYAAQSSSLHSFADALGSYQREARRVFENQPNTPSVVIMTHGIQRSAPASNEQSKNR